ncbi:Rrf2 family transcriptional regulator [uncultured Clostridium sp.]|uniref:RrF2 family transcriptional regulator n=1 Tax=uncultured Clostridium sp. TaxID=59620 RepID=UPI00260E47B0|nr:Rrf2 family transcriptional regulator [uncultured Clostridium sp.]
MKFSVGVEYAMHCLLYMVKLEGNKSVGIKELAKFQGISETYLSKVYGKLSKSGIVKSVPGVKGGYALAKSAEDISFWDVVESIEGKEPFFQCAEIRQNNILVDKENLSEEYTSCPCLIKVVMVEAEEKMREYLKGKTLAWLYDEVYNKKLPKSEENNMIQWFNERIKGK